MQSLPRTVYISIRTIDISQYIGSEHGKDGILGRWTQYVNNYHGDNEKLIVLIDRELERYKKFQFSILRTLPKSMTDIQVITYEQIYKMKIGTRAFGLNRNQSKAT